MLGQEGSVLEHVVGFKLIVILARLDKTFVGEVKQGFLGVKLLGGRWDFAIVGASGADDKKVLVEVDGLFGMPEVVVLTHGEDAMATSFVVVAEISVVQKETAEALAPFDLVTVEVIVSSGEDVFEDGSTSA